MELRKSFHCISVCVLLFVFLVSCFASLFLIGGCQVTSSGVGQRERLLLHFRVLVLDDPVIIYLQMNIRTCFVAVLHLQWRERFTGSIWGWSTWDDGSDHGDGKLEVFKLIEEIRQQALKGETCPFKLVSGGGPLPASQDKNHIHRHIVPTKLLHAGLVVHRIVGSDQATNLLLTKSIQQNIVYR